MGKQRHQEQQPIGLTEEQVSFTFAVAKAQVAAKTMGQYPAPWPRSMPSPRDAICRWPTH